VCCSERPWCISIGSGRRIGISRRSFGELIAGYQQRLDAMPAEREGRVQGLVDQARRNDSILEVLQAERVALIRLWDEGQIDDEVLRTLQRELDLEESGVHMGSIVVH
jgi:monovalent cation/hydrogen antiporter